MQSDLNVLLQTPTANLWNGPASRVKLSTDLGEMEIYPNHATLVGTITFSPVTIAVDGHEEKFLIRRGTVSVDPGGKTVRILAQFADKEEEADLVSIQEYMQFVIDHLKDPEKLNDYQVRFLEEQRTSLEKQIKILQK